MTEGGSLATPPLVSVVVSTFRRPEALRRTLASLQEATYEADRLEVIVVDDGSGDETENVVSSASRGAKFRTTYLRQENRGVATARNRGAREARGDLLLFLDDDILIPPDAIFSHVRIHAEVSDCLVNGHWDFEPGLAAELKSSAFGRFRIEIEEWVKSGIEMKPLQGSRTEPAAVTACNLSLWKSDFVRIGGFDEEFPFAGAEDQEFSRRAKNIGLRFIYDYDLRFWHNDHRLTLRQFCERQRRGAISAALLFLKSPVPDREEPPLIRENREARVGDGITLVAKKFVKRSLAMKVPLESLHFAVGLGEHLGVHESVLRRAYSAICGLYIFTGIREGLQRFDRRPLSSGFHP